MSSARERRELRDRRARRDPGRRRGPWYLLTGLILGLAFGLLFSLRISPVQYVDTAPEVLRQADKDQYRILVALAYQANGDLGRASERLANLHDPAPEAPLAELAQRLVADNQNIETARALAQLASALVQPAGASTQSTPGNAVTTAAATAVVGTPYSTLENAQAIQTATPQPSPTLPAPTVAPRITVTPTLSTPFVLIDRQPVCDPSVEDGLIQVTVQDAAGHPLPGIRITAAWQSGEESFYTGLTPMISPGYADFGMTEGYTYLVTAGEGGEQASGLTTGECTASDGSRRLSGWKLIFALP
ncbi:hypothetical protein LARV_01178 [Longilinea arvoryzae]|uniref:Uncharacterized protein n=1 Tax=Longilinea arvoryzae TaxID=360412 RepID=A0A0S7BEP4_9CHLR|nr:hypothetical protein [Longilinea arvoryzae]GAP13424.1 hypothetical protein LARV_01178 [Longilinea arvoryzae]